MKRKFFTVALAVTLASSLTLTSCIGSFGLSNKVLEWNKDVTGNKFVNELIFLVFWIAPVYEISIFADVVVLNTIEFWTGSNPMAAGEIQKVEGENGTYTVENLENGYNIQNEEGQEMSLIYNQEENTWNSVIEGESTELIKIEGDEATVFINGEAQKVELSTLGVTAFRQSLDAAQLAAK